jgi:hypothetical protein
MVFQCKKEIIAKLLDDVLSEFMDGNPYADHDWKTGKPIRKYKEPFAWLTEHEEEEYCKLSSFCRDIRILHTVFEWENLSEMEYEIEKFVNMLSGDQTNLLGLESLRFNQAKAKFESENKEWCQEQKEIFDHQNAHIGYGVKWRSLLNDPLDDIMKCRFCKELYEKELSHLQKHRVYEINSLQTAYTSPIAKICEECAFKSADSDIFESHFANARHQDAMKRLDIYCDACDIQCQSQIKFKEHCVSTKHKKVMGEIKPIEYSCEKCQYKTTAKHLFNQHLATKKHLNQT